jgi:diguanylate cyclase (GGDEF)-like protein
LTEVSRGSSLMWHIARAFLLLLLAVASGLAIARTEPTLSWPDQGPVAARYWIDTAGFASLQDARSAFDAGQGRAVDFSRIMPLGDGHAAWYRVQLPPTAEPRMVVLAVPFPGIDNAELFRPDGAGGWSRQRAGDSLPVVRWPLPYLHPAFAFSVQPGEAQPTYLRLQHSHPIGVYWTLTDASSFNESSKLWHLVLGACVGFMLLVIVLSLVHAWSWRDPIHLYYAVHVLLVGLSLMSVTGIAGEYLWPRHAWWNDIASVAVPTAALGWMGLLVRELVAERGERLVSWGLLGHVAVSAFLVLALLVAGRQVFPLPSVYAMVSLLFIVLVLGWYSLRRPKVGLWVLAGMGLLVAGTVFPLLRNLGLLPVSFATQYGPQIGGALEIPLVLVGLYFRSRERRDNRVRLDALSHTDPLTGVANHRALLERLDQLLRRARRHPDLGGVLRVQVANLASIRGEYGREAAEAALVRAAECVTREATEADLVAREQGGDLVLVMEGKVARAQAVEAARNIIARGLKFSGRLPPGVTVTLRVAGIASPLPATTAAALLAELGRTVQELATDLLGRGLRIVESEAGLEHP